MSGAKAQTYTFSSAGAGILTLTGADGSGPARSRASRAWRERDADAGLLEHRRFDHGAGERPGKAVADLITDLTAAANDTIVVTGSGAASLQVGANSGDSLSISFTNMQTEQLGAGSDLFTLITTTPTSSTQAKASTLISELDGAISDVNAQRGTFGAAQNRLEHTVKSLERGG